MNNHDINKTLVLFKMTLKSNKKKILKKLLKIHQFRRWENNWIRSENGRQPGVLEQRRTSRNSYIPYPILSSLITKPVLYLKQHKELFVFL